MKEVNRNLILKSLVYGFLWAVLHIILTITVPFSEYIFFTLMLIGLGFMFKMCLDHSKEELSRIKVITSAIVMSYTYLLCFLPYYYYTMKVQEIGKSLDFNYFLQNFRNAVIFFTIVSVIVALIAQMIRGKFLKKD